MTESAITGSLANWDCAAFGSAPRDALHLPYAGRDEKREQNDGRAGADLDVLSANELNYLIEISEGNCLQMDETRLSLTGATTWQVMRGLAEARCAILTLQVAKGFSRISQIEPILGDLPNGVAKKIEFMVRLLRAVGFALQDDILPALHFAQSAIKQARECHDSCTAKTVCRLVYWKLGDLDSFYALPRNRLWSATNGKEAICNVFDLAIEAAVEFNQLRLSSARHLAQDALVLAERTSPRHAVLTALPASLLAQFLYEQGSLEEAEQMVVSHLQAIEMAGTIECALVAYPILARAASRRGQHARAGAILDELEDTAKQRGWRRLAAASIAERVNLLLENDKIAEAAICVDALECLETSPDTVPSSAQSDIHRIWTLARARVTLARGPSRSAVAILRQLQREAVNRQDLYGALQLAIRLVDALEVIGEQSEAFAVLLRALTLGSAVGVYQAFLDGGPRVQKLLVHVYDHPPTSDVRLRGLLPYIGSLLDRNRARETARASTQPHSRSTCILSERERVTLIWMSHGLSNKGIAKKLGVTPETIKSHAKKIFLKLTAKTRAEAVSRASSLGLI